MKEALILETTKEIYGWGFTSDYIESQVRTFDKKKHKKMIVPINSYGGDVMEGLAIYNMLKGFDGEVETRIIGYAMSMGTIIALAGDVVSMPENGYFMIHEPSGMEFGDADMMAATSMLLDNMAIMMAGIYSSKTGIPADEIRAMMKAETWLTGKKAKEMGFVDVLTEGVRFEASFPVSKFKNIPNEIKAIESDKKTEGNQEDIAININKNHDMSFVTNLGSFLGFKPKEGSNEPEMTPEQFYTALEDKVSMAVTNKVQTTIDDLNASLEAISNRLDELSENTDTTSLVASVAELKTTIAEMKVASDEQDSALSALLGKVQKSTASADGPPNFKTAAEINLQKKVGLLKADTLEAMNAAFDNF